MICPECKRWIPDGSVFCMFCGKRVETEPPVKQEPPQQSGATFVSAPDWAEGFAEEFPQHRWMILRLSAMGWSEQMLRDWLAKLG